MERDLTLFEEYSTEHDAIMMAEMAIVKGAYGRDFMWSFTLSNDTTGMVEHEFMDGNHPIYKKHFREVLKGMGLKEKDVFDSYGDYEVLADYPRHGSKLRYLFKDRDVCLMALAKIEKAAA